MSNSLDPDQARQFVGPDLGPNCLPRLSANDTGRQIVNSEPQHFVILYFLVNFTGKKRRFAFKHIDFNY